MKTTIIQSLLVYFFILLYIQGFGQCPPTPSITIHGSTTLCLNAFNNTYSGHLTLGAPVYGPDTSYIWLQDGIEIQSSNNNNFYPNTPGTYWVETVSNGCTSQASNPIQVGFNVVSKPFISSTIPIINDWYNDGYYFGFGPMVNLCEGANTTLTGYGAYNPGTTYRWLKNNLPISDTTETISVNAPGLYSVYAILGGCTTETSDAVYVRLGQTVRDTTVGYISFNGVFNGMHWAYGLPDRWNNYESLPAGFYYDTVHTFGLCDSIYVLNLINCPAPVPTLGFAPNSPHTFCNCDNLYSTIGGFSTDLIATQYPVEAGVSYVWYKNNWELYQSWSNDPYLGLLADSGYYSVSTVVNGCTSAPSNTVYVGITNLNKPSIAVSTTANGIVLPNYYPGNNAFKICNGFPAFLSLNYDPNNGIVPISSYIWSINGIEKTETTGSIKLGIDDIFLTYNKPLTSYTVTVQTVANGCTSNVSDPVEVDFGYWTDPMVPWLDIYANICAGESYYYNGIAFNTTGNYNVSNNNFYYANYYYGNCDTLKILHLTVSAPLAPTVIPSGPTGICKGGTVKLNGNATGVNVSTFAGNGSTAFADGFLSNARFRSPSGIATDPAGNIYVADGGNNCIRKIDLAGNVSTLAGNVNPGFADGNGSRAQFNFGGFLNAAGFSNPQKIGICLDAAGNVVVADRGNNKIRKIDGNGNVTTVNTLYQDTLYPYNLTIPGPISVTTDKNGNIYIADLQSRRIEKIDNAGIYSIFAGYYDYSYGGIQDGIGTNARFSSPTALTFDEKGNLLVADAYTIRKIDSAGKVTTIIADSISFRQFIGLTNDQNGNIYALQEGGYNYRNNKIYGQSIIKLEPGGNKSVIAGDSALGLANSNGTNPNLVDLYGLATDGAGNLFATSPSSNLIYKIDNSGNAIPLAGGNTTFADGSPSLARFNNPQGLAKDDAGNIYVADIGNGKIRKIDVSGNVGTIDGNGHFICPNSVVVDASGNIIVSDSSGIQKMDISGNVSTIANFRGTLAIDAFGIVYVINNPNQISKIDHSGNVSTLAGSATAGYADSNGTTAKFNSVSGLTFDKLGNIYVTDNGNNCIRKIDSNGNVSTFAGNGKFGWKDGDRKQAQFSHPSGITIDEAGNFYISEGVNSSYNLDSSFGNRIRKIDTAGIVTTIAGTSSRGFADGNASGTSGNVKFNGPAGLVTDVAGNIYVADAGNNRIRKIVPKSDFIKYRWSNGDTTQNLTATDSGNYTLQTIVGGCTSLPSKPVVITINPDTVRITASGPTTFCKGDNITLTAFGGTSYLWNDSSTSNPRRVSKTGNYSVRAISGFCTSKVSNVIAVTVNADSATISASGPTTICPGDSITLTAIGGTNYLWNDSSTANPRRVGTPGNYFVKAINGTCTSLVSNVIAVTVIQPTTPVITASGPTTFCKGDSVILSATGGTSYLWNDSSTANPRTVSTTGNYSVKAINGSCTSQVSNVIAVTLNQATPPLITVSGPTTLCNGDSVTLTASGGIAYLWNDSSTANPRRVSTTGNYSVKAINGTCTSQAGNLVSVTVNKPSTPVITVLGSASLLPGDSVNLSGPVADAYIWSNGKTTQSIFAFAPDSVRLRIVINGCTSAASIPVILTVQHGNVTVSGTIRSVSGVPINGVTVKPSLGQTINTSSTGFFTISVPYDSSLGIGAFKDNDTSRYNGVSTFDCVLIKRQTLGIAPFNNAYKTIAADVNHNGSVTTLDMVLIRDFILGNRTDFFGRLWAFVPANETFSDPNNPFPFDSARYFTSLKVAATNQDFVGFRLGDVNNSWNPALGRTSFARGITLGLPNLSAQAGTEVLVPVTSTDFSDIAGLQFTLGWDATKADYLEIVSAALTDVQAGTRWTPAGNLALSWMDAQTNGHTYPDGTILFYLKLRLRSNATGTIPLTLGSAAIPAEATSGQATLVGLPAALGSINLVGITATQANISGNTLLEVQPNPFKEQTTIRFQMLKIESVCLKIQNAIGQEVYLKKFVSESGINQITWNRTDTEGQMLASGTYIVLLQTESGMQTVKLVVQ